MAMAVSIFRIFRFSARYHWKIVDPISLVEQTFDLGAPVSVSNLMKIRAPWTTGSFSANRYPLLLHWAMGSKNRIYLMHNGDVLRITLLPYAGVRSRLVVWHSVPTVSVYDITEA